MDATRLTDLETKFDEIVHFDIELLRESSSGGLTASLTGLIDPAKRVIGLYQRIDRSVFREVSDNLLETFAGALEPDRRLLMEAVAFRPDEGNPRERFQSIQSALVGRYDSTFGCLWPLIVYSESRKATADARLKQLDEATGRFEFMTNELKKIQNQFAEEATTILKSYSERSEAILATLMDAAALAGITKQAKHFSGEARKHRRQARTWLYTSVAAMFVLLLCAGLNLWFSASYPVHDTLNAVQVAISKAVVLAVVAFAVLTSMKNYHAHKHNAEVNQHRENAIRSYATFVAATKEDDKKNAILVYVASAVFTPTETGFTSIHPPEIPSVKSLIEFGKAEVPKSVTTH